MICDLANFLDIFLHIFIGIFVNVYIHIKSCVRVKIDELREWLFFLVEGGNVRE